MRACVVDRAIDVVMLFSCVRFGFGVAWLRFCPCAWMCIVVFVYLCSFVCLLCSRVCLIGCVFVRWRVCLFVSVGCALVRFVFG